MPEVRSYVAKLDEKFPYWLFFLSKHHGSLALGVQVKSGQRKGLLPEGFDFMR